MVTSLSGDGGGGDVGAGFNAVGDDFVFGLAWSFFNALDVDETGAGAGDFSRPFLMQQVGEVDDFGFARGVFDDGLAFGKNSGHQNVFCARDCDAVKHDAGTFESVRRGGFHVAMLLRDLRAEEFKAGEVLVDWDAHRVAQPPGRETRARPARATSGPRTRLPLRRAWSSRARREPSGEIMRGVSRLTLPAFDSDVRADVLEGGAPWCGCRGSARRDAIQDDFVFGEEGCGESGEGGVFRAAGRDGAVQRCTAFDDKFIHYFLFYCRL